VTSGAARRCRHTHAIPKRRVRFALARLLLVSASCASERANVKAPVPILIGYAVAGIAKVVNTPALRDSVPAKVTLRSLRVLQLR
jgi:hypothetical protein